MVIIYFEIIPCIMSITQNLRTKKRKDCQCCGHMAGMNFFLVLGCFGRGKLIVVKCFQYAGIFHQCVPPVCLRLCRLADRGGFWVGVCLRHGPECYPAKLCLVPVSWESQVMEWKPKPCMPTRKALPISLPYGQKTLQAGRHFTLTSGGMWGFSDLLRSHKKSSREENMLSIGTMYSKGSLN